MRNFQEYVNELEKPVPYTSDAPVKQDNQSWVEWGQIMDTFEWSCKINEKEYADAILHYNWNQEDLLFAFMDDLSEYLGWDKLHFKQRDNLLYFIDDLYIKDDMTAEDFENTFNMALKINNLIIQM